MFIVRLFRYLFISEPKFKVGDIIQEYGSEEWENDYREILRVGNEKYQYKMLDCDVDCDFYIVTIDMNYRKIGEK